MLCQLKQPLLKVGAQYCASSGEQIIKAKGREVYRFTIGSEVYGSAVDRQRQQE